MDKFSVTPYEEMPIDELGIEELESRLEMSTAATDVEVIIGIEVSW